MFFANRRLIVVPTSCLLAGAMVVTGMEGCASRRAARTEAPVETASAQATPTPAPQPTYGTPTPVMPAPAAPPVPQNYQPPPAAQGPIQPTDRGPNFLPEPMLNEDLPSPAEGKAGASKSKLGQKFAGFKWGGSGARADKKNKRQAKNSTEPQTGTQTEPDPVYVQPGDKLAKRSKSLPARQASLPAARKAAPVKLSPPAEIYQYTDDRTPEEATSWRMSFPSQQNPYRQTSLPSNSRSIPARPASTSSMQNDVQWRTPAPVQERPADDEFGPLPQWPYSAESQPKPVIRPQPQPFQMPRLERAPAHSYQTEPSRVSTTPSLRQMPVSATRVKQAPNEGPLGVSRIALCRDVRSYNQFTEIDVSHLQPGQQFLIYAALENFRSISTLKGFQTLTMSSLEVWTRGGQFVSRQTLGTATDLADAPREQYYLTHAMKVPENLADGDYVLQLNVYDLNSKETGKGFVAVRIMGDRNHQGATGGSGELVSRPSIPRR